VGAVAREQLASDGGADRRDTIRESAEPTGLLTCLQSEHIDPRLLIVCTLPTDWRDRLTAYTFASAGSGDRSRPLIMLPRRAGIRFRVRTKHLTRPSDAFIAVVRARRHWRDPAHSHLEIRMATHPARARRRYGTNAPRKCLGVRRRVAAHGQFRRFEG
jgi:hypothetical protein